MSAGDRGTLAAELGKHRDLAEDTLQTCFCACGARICPEDGGMSHDWHFRAHVADVLLASDWLREQRAEAWDDGYEGCCEIDREENEAHDYCPNPYQENIESSNNGLG